MCNVFAHPELDTLKQGFVYVFQIIMKRNTVAYSDK